MILIAVIYIALIVACLKAGKLRGIHPALCVIGALLLGPLMLVLFLVMDRRKEKRKIRDLMRDDDTDGIQKLITGLLYLSLLTHSIGLLLDDLNILTGLVPVLQLVTVVAAGLFFLAQALLTSPMGLLIMTMVSGLLFLVMPYIVTFLLLIVAEGFVMLILGGIVAAATTSLVVVVVNGSVVAAALVPMITLPMTIGAATLGGVGMLGAGMTLGMNEAMKQRGEARLMKLGQIAINLLLLVMLVWPVLSWTDAFCGVFALKPAATARLAFEAFRGNNVSVNYEEYFERTGSLGYYTINSQENWTFGEGFYDSYIYPGRNSFAQGAYPSAADGRNIAYCINGKVYQVDTADEEIYKITACSPEPEDAMVMVGKETFLFRKDEIMLMGRYGRYRWRDTNWRSDFEKLSDDEQLRRLYTILEAQNDGIQGEIGVEDVAVVAYAQRNGLLLYYDSERHAAYFGQEGQKGSITILRMGDWGVEKCTAFTPECDSDNLPYTMLDADTLAYIRNDQVIFKDVDTGEEQVYLTADLGDGITRPVESFHVLHDQEGTEFYACLAPDVLYLQMKGERLHSYPYDPEKYDGIYSVGTELYCIEYDTDSLVNRLTFLNDRIEGEALTHVWTENPVRNKITLDSSLKDPVEPEETTPAVPTFEERYPVPELRTSVRQVGLYQDNVASPSDYAFYQGPVKNFCFRFPKILYENVDYTWSEDETEVRIRFWNEDEASSLTVTLRPNTEGVDHQSLAKELLKLAGEKMTDEKIVRSGLDNEDGTASSFYLRGYAADDTGLICIRLCRVDSAYIMEMELRVPKANGNEDEAYKEFYIMVMECCCGFGSGDEYLPFWKFKKNYGL